MYSGHNSGAAWLPASTMLAPVFAARIICSRFARVVETGRPRSPSLPPFRIGHSGFGHCADTFEPVGGGVAADAGVDHVIAVTALVQLLRTKSG
jgi:hypothetical protein